MGEGGHDDRDHLRTFDRPSDIRRCVGDRREPSEDVTDELKTMGIDVQKDIWTAGQRCCVFEGRVYGFPTNAAVNARL